MPRHLCYQSLIVEDECILPIRHQEHDTGRAYWVIPGGGREKGDTERACVIREMKEETNLIVEVERLFIGEAVFPDAGYVWRKSSLCRWVSGVM